MGLADNLAITAKTLIATYGNTVELSITTNDGVYNPQTGSMGTPVTTTYTKSAYVSNATNEELKVSGLPENEWKDVSFVATMISDTETSQLNNSWTLDGRKISKVVKTQAQDTVVVLKVYCG